MPNCPPAPIDEKTARPRRRDLEEESGFYGAMDGAAKFVRGDAIAGLIITFINILGGLAIGLVRHGMAFADAAATYTTLTVGDGLVSQIPALLVSTAAGIVVTKGGTEGTRRCGADAPAGRQPQAAGAGRRRRRGAGADAGAAGAAVPGAGRAGRRRRPGCATASAEAAAAAAAAAAAPPPRRPSRRSAKRCGWT